ncbi:MAG: hypothetical protein F4X66_12045 [Chloroflexi bacterium]|nr:hypothetical protein [Chloroflexota bacterium]MYE39659.1 hypothetical protein [Chloroflexota bacterium]
MAATELNNRPAVEEANVTELSVKVAEQVSEILEEAKKWERIPRPAVAYRVPSPGVRYYF